MSSAAFKDALRTGRDPNDATWKIVRYAEDWARAGLEHLIHDGERGVVELEPIPCPDPEADRWLPLEPVSDAAGNQYRADPDTHRLLCKPVCEDEFKPIPNVGGQGSATGRFNRPLGVTLDFRGWLYVADAGNHRVQIVRPENGSVVAVLGAVDESGQPLAGTSGGAMMEPVHACVDPCNCHTYIADRQGGMIHVFDQHFQYLISFAPQSLEPPTLAPRSPGQAPLPVAVAVVDHGRLLVLDTTRPMLLAMTADGEPLPAVACHSIENPFQGGKPLWSHFYEAGTAIIGPLDSGTYDMAWHRILLEAGFHTGTSISVQTYADNAGSASPETLPWAPTSPLAIPLAAQDSELGQYQRPVQSDTTRWLRYQHGSYSRAKPVLCAFHGDGPVATDSFHLSCAAASRVRAGDTLEFVTASLTDSAVIDHIDDHSVAFTAAGSARLYGAGSQLYLLERDDEAMPGMPRCLYQLTGGEVLDFATLEVDGTLQEYALPHALAAFFQPGDLFEIREGADRIRLAIERLDPGKRLITLTQALTDDFANSQLLLINTPGRLVVNELEGFEYHPVPHETIDVTSADSSEQANILFVETAQRAIWLEPGSLGPLVGFDDWSAFTTSEDKATDRGRYLWIRLIFYGPRSDSGDDSAAHTPALHSVRALMPRLSYLTYLPATYARRDKRNDPSGALFLERFLALFEYKLTEIEAVYESVSTLLSPETRDEHWLRYVAAWLGLVFDQSWSVQRRRQLVLEAADLYQRRGTPAALQRFLEIYTGRRPALLEGYQWRPSAALVIGRSGRLGCSLLGGIPCNYQPYAHRFTLFVFLEEGCDLEAREPAIRNIVETLKPAHVEYTLCFVLPKTRIGIQSRVGIDTVVGDIDEPVFHLGQGGAPLGKRIHPVLGFDRVPGEHFNRRSRRATELSHGGARCDHGFTLN